MRQWSIQNDRIMDNGEVPYLGIPYDKIKEGLIPTLPKDFDGWFPFMRMCYSVGDLGILSGVPEALKAKYPKIKIAMPSAEYIQELFGNRLRQWQYGDNNPIDNVKLVYDNNPHIDHLFEMGEFDFIFTDHDRSYTGLVHDGTMIRSKDEPLAEQILRRFGFDDNDIATIDSRPKLYFTEEEIQKGDEFIKKYMGDDEYGCLLFSSRLEKYKGRWSEDYHLLKEAEQYYNTPVFSYSTFSINHNEWGDLFKTCFSFTALKASLRLQLYVKSKAKFNLGYQAGITDTVGGSGTQNISLCPYPTIRENCIRGARYVFLDGTVKQF